MNTQLLVEVLECLQGGRTVFTYYRDAYAIYLLRRAIAEQEAIMLRELKQSRWASLLNRPFIRDLVARCGDGYLRKEQLKDNWRENKEPFVLTVGTWSDVEGYEWDQISRPGSNLVLQLNLSNKWHQQFQSLVHEPANDYFGYGHPLSRTRKMTLAWARLDFDFETNEVLVEEIQTDLVRHIARMQKKALEAIAKKDDHFDFYDVEINALNFSRFADRFLHAFKKTWQESMLAATVSFVFDELGVEHLFYHTFETGSLLKNIEDRHPPRSLYRDLPEKFCFEETIRAPEFLQRDRHVRRKLKNKGMPLVSYGGLIQQGRYSFKPVRRKF